MKKTYRPKQFWVLLLALLFACSAAACSPITAAPEPSPSASVAPTPSPSSAGTQEEPPQESEAAEEPQPKTETMGINAFEQLLSQLPLSITSTSYVVQNEQHKALYPDMLQVILYNGTETDIKNAVVAFAAWDQNNLPVKIKGSIDFTDGAYIRQVDFDDINLIPNDSYGDNSGFSVDENCNIEFFKAVVVSFEDFDGDTWENPYFDAWTELYEGKKYSDDLTVDVTIKDADFTATDHGSSRVDHSSIEESELDTQISAQEVKVVSTKYVVQNDRHKTLYPDMLQAVIANGSDSDIRDAVVAFVAWDENGLPVKIKGSIDFSDGAYIREVNYSDINLIPGGEYGSNSGFEINEDCGIVEFKAILVSYETFEDESWSNPLYDDWCSLYEGKTLR